MEKKYDIIVAGGGHAGIEAALTSAKLGLKTALITLRQDTIGKMSCNPAIGGLAKGHLVREIDALGGVMAKLIDQTGIHFKMLNKSKGPAVWSPRAQADRIAYSKAAQRAVLSQKNLDIIQSAVIGLKTKQNRVTGAILDGNIFLPCKALILTCGTFLNGKIYIGLNEISSGRAGELPVKGLTESLVALGFKSGRLKTGTPPRLHRDSIDYSKMVAQHPDEQPVPFSFHTSAIHRKQINCYLSHTTPETHQHLQSGLDRSPMYTGMISGVGPRYCPSIEDKIVRFADKDRHQLFLEPEGYESKEVYVNGFATSLPEDVQIRAIHSVPGLEKAKFVRLGYAIEYDFFPSYQIKHTLETKGVEGLYFAGQINGTSGYEEAAAQGLLAGINAAQKVRNQPPLILNRSQAYIGVLIDDLINKTILEPYRMFTSRAEFRLLLRHDNADLRLMEIGHKLGLIPRETFEKMLQKKENITQLINFLSSTSISAESFNKYAREIHSPPIQQKTPVTMVLKRPEVKLAPILKLLDLASVYSEAEIVHVEFATKYTGYLKRQDESIQKFRAMEKQKIPEDFDYRAISGLSTESREKLSQIRPASLGQAGRIAGVRQGDISVLLIYLDKHSRSKKTVSRETG